VWARSERWWQQAWGVPRMAGREVRVLSFAHDSLLLWVLAASGLTYLVVVVVVPMVARVALALKAVDYPGGRREHEGVVPRLGGVAVVFGLAFGAGTVALINWGHWGQVVERAELVVFALAIGLMFLVGVIDDLIGVSFWKKLLAQLAAAWMVVALGWQFNALYVPWIGKIDVGPVGQVLTLLWVVGITNAINLIDGLDGLASGVIAIIAGSLLVLAVVKGSFFTVVLMAAIVGACLGFLRYNWRGEVFLGDSGSQTLGFILAVMSVHGSLKASAAVAILVPMLALGVPAMDTMLVMLVRFVGRPKGTLSDRFLAIFRADRNHMHHLMESWAGDRSRVVKILYVMVAISCGMALVVAATKNFQIGFALVLAELLAVGLIRRAGMAARARVTSTEQRSRVRRWLVGRGFLPESVLNRDVAGPSRTLPSADPPSSTG
jgi:UDP-GlcNAc:undecaprenyl-phosphate GlcNAc-1-phosphate transferase